MGCGIRKGYSKLSVYKKELQEFGNFNGVDTVREATEKDITWVKAMGGKIPK